MRNILIVLSMIMFSGNLFCQDFKSPTKHDEGLKYNKNEVIVKFKDDVDVKLETRNSVALTGVLSVDKVMTKFQATELSQVFRGCEKQSSRKINRFPDGTLKPVPQLFNIYLVKTTGKKDVKEAVDELNQLDEVEYAEVNGEMYLTDFAIQNQLEPLSKDIANYKTRNSIKIPEVDDPLFPDQWGIPEIKADSLWDETTGDTTIVVAVLDTGVDWMHPDLDDNIWTNWDEIPDNGIDDDGNGYIDDVRGWDFINDDNNPMDDNSHGTHCAGIIGAEVNNGIGIAGVAWDVKIMPVKVMQSGNFGSYIQVSQGVWYAAENNANIYNMSLGSYFESTTLRLALEYAYSTGIIVAAAGNNGYKIDEPTPPFPLTNPHFPAAYGWVLGVEATMPGGNNAWFSNYDPTGPIIHDARPYGWIFHNYAGYNYEMRAPGVGIWSTVPNGGYRMYSGTSMAAPLVAGAIALMKSYNNSYTNEEIFAKLIQPNKIDLFNAGVLDIQKSTLTYPDPDIYFERIILADTALGDGDGRPDAGEYIDMYVRAINAGGVSDTTWGKLVFSEFEDTTTVNIIMDSCYFGSMSTYSSMNSLTPFKIQIDNDLVDGRVIRMDVLLIQRVSGVNDTSVRTVYLDVEHGFEIKGVNSFLHLTPDFYYIVTEPAVIDTLIIDPGVTINFKSNTYLVIINKVYAVGTPDSMITFKAADASIFWKGISHSNIDNIYEYCIFRDGYVNYTNHFITGNAYSITNSIFKENYATLFLFTNFNQNVSNNVFVENKFNGYGDKHLIMYARGIFKNNVVINNTTYREGTNVPGSSVFMYTQNYSDWDEFVTGNVIFNNHDFTEPYGVMSYDVGIAGAMNIYNINNSYHGSNDSIEIHSYFQDFFVDPARPILLPNNILNIPPPEAHGVVWKVLINDVNPQESSIEPIGPGLHKIDVIFNRAMDIDTEPMVTYGVRFPYTQYTVGDSTSWSADSTKWTGYFSVNMYQSNGENTIRVAYARDDENFEIPIERDRFKFTIQAVNSQSVNFTAIPGIGKVILEWPLSDSANVLGYKIYRYTMPTDSTFSDTTQINSNLILDTIFSDYNVIPDTPYYYMFTMVYTDLAESDFSKIVTATPFDAANGDANGSMDVNVLDITTIVNYMLGQNPEPFLFDAADVNYDGNINVLDIIGVVQIIQGKKSVPLSSIVNQSQEVAWMHKRGNHLVLESEGNVAALYFELKGENLQELKLKAQAQGFELAISQSDTLVQGIMFSLSGKSIAAGETILLAASEEIENCNLGRLEGGDWDGQDVPILKEGQVWGVVEQNELEVFPNPFSESVSIYYQLKDISDLQIKVFKLNGQQVEDIQLLDQEKGSYQLVWGEGQAKGIYLMQMEVRSAKENWKKEVKLIHM